MSSNDTPTPSQPSTTPGASNPASGTQQPCHPACTLTSQTVATSPSNRARTRIGVGEEVTLTVTGNPATWSKSGDGTLSPNSGTQASVTFTAGESAGSVTITATGSGCSCSNSITFTVVEPSSWKMKRKSGTNLKHTNGRPDCGWTGSMYIQPTDVNFYRVETREMDSQAVTTGSYGVFNNVWHGNYPLPDRASSWLSVGSHTDADGSKVNMIDNIYSGDPAAAANPAPPATPPPFVVGTMYFSIVFQWRVTGSATNNSFSAVRQEHEIFSNGRCESKKGGHTESSMYNDPTSTP